MILHLIFSQLFFYSIGADIFASMVDIQKLKDVEKIFTPILKKFVNSLEQKLNDFKRELDLYEKHRLEIPSDDLEMIPNPINKFLIFKRLTVHRKNVEKLLTYDDMLEFIDTLESEAEKIQFPTKDDVKGAALAIRRLQRTYNLETSDLANGIIKGVKRSSALSADDCYDMGKLLFDEREYEFSAKWLKESVDREYTKPNSTISREELFRYLIVAYDAAGNATQGLKILDKLMEITPDDPKALKMRLKFETFNKETQHNEKEENELIEDEYPDIDPKNPLRYDDGDRKYYERLCREDVLMTPRQLASLHCRYTTNNSSYLRIAPVKLEERSLDPYIVLFHDVIYNSEIEIMKDLAKPKFRRSLILDPTVGEHRVSKTSWVNDDDDDLVKKLSQRIQHMTGLSVKTAEEFQVLNYGIGGHYEPHFDFCGDKDLYHAFEFGNRIATILFYLSHVIDGGATVFPHANVTVTPEKGSAILWYNLYKSGKGDFRTKHAACPVIVGTKWVANKWLHQHGQEFTRPCLLYADHPSKNDYDF